MNLELKEQNPRPLWVFIHLAIPYLNPHAFSEYLPSLLPDTDAEAYNLGIHRSWEIFLTSTWMTWPSHVFSRKFMIDTFLSHAMNYNYM